MSLFLPPYRVARNGISLTLSGSVCSSSENEKAVAAAWAASGVTNVATLLTIES
jgi:osmotically-inducible protein OsmY